MEIVIQGILLVLGFVMLIKGADWFVEGASGIADRFGIPQLVIGLTIVAFGTSAPEAAVSISAAMKGNADITIGNVVGSNILNILIILGLTAVICPIAVQKSTFKYEIPYVILVSVAMFGLGYFDQTVSRVDGIILWVMMIVYMIYLLNMAKKGEANAEAAVKEEKKPIWKLLILVAVGLVLIVWGSDVTVNAATNIALAFNVSERIIGLTIVALGTSLPELMTSVTAARKGKADIAIGNVVGSNIFNILFVVATTAVITPVVYAESFLVDSVMMIESAVLLWLCLLGKEKKLKRWAGAIMLGLYAGYLIYMLMS
ncbi:MAG: calcium/sodium antiporter [Lachnospiraceae bacterium]|nr:calcium/sodium antiporter [Lachnospiraceae bacterium]